MMLFLLENVKNVVIMKMDQKENNHKIIQILFYLKEIMFHIYHQHGIKNDLINDKKIQKKNLEMN